MGAYLMLNTPMPRTDWGFAWAPHCPTEAYDVRALVRRVLNMHVQGHGEGSRSSSMMGAVRGSDSIGIHLSPTLPETRKLKIQAKFRKSRKKSSPAPIHGYVSSLSPRLRLVFRKAKSMDRWANERLALSGRLSQFSHWQAISERRGNNVP